MGKRSKSFKHTEIKQVVDQQRTLAASTIELIAQLWTISKDQDVKPIRIKMSCGIDDDPLDETIMWALGLADPNNLPTMTQFLREAIWSHVEAWRVIGTPANSVETVDDEDDAKLSTTFASSEAQIDTAIVLVVDSTTTSRTVTVGQIEAVITRRQITYNNDGSEMGQSPFNLGGAGV